MCARGGMEREAGLGREYLCVPVIHVPGVHAVLQLGKLILWVSQASSSCRSPGV